MEHLYLYDFKFKLQHLRYFIAVAQELNITHAAEQLGMAQPQLSQQIGELEDRLGVQLFDRSKHRITLTAAGQTFLEEVRSIMNQLERAIEITQRASRGEIGRLVIGFNSSVSNSVLPDILKAFRARFPKVQLVLQEHTAYNLIEELQTQQIDIGLMHWSSSNIQDTTLCVLSIQEEPFIVVLSENHPLACEREISIHSLDDETFILPPFNLPYSLYEPSVSFWKQENFRPKETQEATLVLTILSLVAGGIGVSLLPTNVQNLQRKGVVYKTLKEHPPNLQIVATWRHDNSSTILENFLEVIQNRF